MTSKPKTVEELIESVIDDVVAEIVFGEGSCDDLPPGEGLQALMDEDPESEDELEEDLGTDHSNSVNGKP